MNNKTGNNKISVKAKRLIALIASFVLAIALAVTCLCINMNAPKRQSVDGVESGNVSTSVALGALTGNALNTKVNAKQVNVGDYMEYGLTSSVVSVLLPEGKYTLEVWGGQGGGGYTQGAGTMVGGIDTDYAKGGYTTATYTVPKDGVTVFICVGGAGANGAAAPSASDAVSAGGYNGGAKSGVSSNGQTWAHGGGGGGATHIALSGGLLSTFETKKADLLIVAGGAGGVGGYYPTADSHGGGETGGKGTSGSCGGPGRQDGPGAAPVGACGQDSNYGNGKFGEGGKGESSQAKPGGGGGGYYGGAGGSDGGNGGGGSGYINTSVNSTYGKITGGTTTAGQRKGNGLARITVVTVNKAPQPTVAGGKTVYTDQTLGKNKTLDIVASNIANDPDPSTGYTAESVWFTDGTDTNYDTCDSPKLYLDEACATEATSYLSWALQGTNKDTIRITEIKRLPRGGANGQANGTFTLYAKLRDAYGSSGAARGYKVIPFKISMATVSSNHTSDLSDDNKSGRYRYRYGQSTTQSAADIQKPNTLYSSSAVGSYALTVIDDIKIGESVTIDASKLLKDYDSTYYQPYIVPGSTNAQFSYSGTTTTIYDYTSGTSYSTITNAYSSITINALKTHTGYQSTAWTLYLVEKSTSRGDRYEPTSIAYNGTGGQTINVNFRVGNTRPVLRNSNNVVNVAVGGTANASLESLFTDGDGTITASTHSIDNIVVPQYEFVQVNRYGEVQSAVNAGGASDDKSYYNVVGSLSTADDGTISSAMSDTPTTFSSKIAVPTSAAQEEFNEAFLTYTFSGITITLNGLRASYSQYDLTRGSATAYTGGTISAPTGSASVDNPGHFYLLVHIKDNMEQKDNVEPADGGIWLPVAVTVGAGTDNGLKPVNTATSPGSVSGQDALSTVPPCANGNVGDTFYFVPMAINVKDAEPSIIASKVLDEGNEIDPSYWKALALDGDNFATTENADISRAAGTASWSNKLNEFIYITSQAAQLQSGFFSNSSLRTKDFVTVGYVDVLIPKTYFGGRVTVGSANSQNPTTGVNTVVLETSDDPDYSDYYITKGIKITLNAPTMNRYLYTTVWLSDSSGRSVSTEISVRVNDVDPESLPELLENGTKNGSIAVFGQPTPEGATAVPGSVYSNVASEGTTSAVATLLYKVPLNSTFMLTPYDLVNDINLAEAGATRPANGFTLNGFSGAYNDGVFTIDGELVTGGRLVKALFDPAYGTADYRSSIYDYIDALDTPSVGKTLHDDNVFGTAAGKGQADIPNDRLFFSRSTDDTSDAFTFAPTGYEDFSYTASGLSGYVTCYYGDTVVFPGSNGNIEKCIDFVLFSATARTPKTAEFTITVRDRYGDALIPVCVKIDVINTAPNMRANLTAAEIAVKPVQKNQEDDDGATTVVTVTPNSTVILPGSVMEDKDGDSVTFVTSRGVLVARGGDHDLTDFAAAKEDTSEFYKYLYDKDTNGKLLTDYYIKVTLDSANQITVTAIGSTKNIPEGVFVYFFAADPRGGIALGCKQIEVINTAPDFNTSNENGFSTADKLWSIESTNDADIRRERYIAGSQNAVDSLRSTKNAAAIDVKLIATDADALQGVLLSQCGSSQTEYVNYISGVNGYDKAVPNVNNISGYASDNPAAIRVYKTTLDGSSNSALENVTPTLMFLINDDWYTRDELISELEGTGTNTVTHTDCFDGYGRFVVRDWALMLKATNAFVDEGGSLYKIGIDFSLRDDPEFGGNTAGHLTAYDSDRSKAQIKIDKTLNETVFMFISSTGIVTKDEFSKYNDYYVVTGLDNKNYLITYNGTTAGVSEYQASTASGVANTFKYPNTIEVPGNKDGSDTYETVYVPMSYFGLSSSIASPNSSTGDITYGTTFVAYDVRTDDSEASYDRGNIDQISAAITLTDAVGGKWSGSTLNENPYVTIDAVNGGSDVLNFGVGVSKPYFNDRLAVAYDTTYNSGVQTVLPSSSDKQIVFLNDQKTKLTEHSFGLKFTKKDFRTNVNKLTLTVKLSASASVAPSGSSTINTTTAYNSDSENLRTVSVFMTVGNSPIDLKDGVRVDYGPDAPVNGPKLEYDDVRGTYYTNVALNTSESVSYLLVRDGGNTDKNDIASSNKYKRIYYTDSDLSLNDDGSSTAYRDYAYFASESISGLSDTALKRIKETYEYGDASSDTALSNVALKANGHAQESMLNYLGLSEIADIDDVTSGYMANGGKHGYSSYFTASMAENSRAINIAASRKTEINIAALPYIAKELAIEDSSFNINWDDDYTYGGLSYKQLKGIYESRGFVYTIPDGVTDNSTVPNDATLNVYYPLKVIIYDNCGAGWSDASYVSMEFRISIANTAPKLKTSIGTFNAAKNRREYEMKLAAGDSLVLNLYDFIDDPDILILSGGDVRLLANKRDFMDSEDGTPAMIDDLTRETGDYLESLYSYNYTAYSDAEGIQNALLSGNGGISASDEIRSDVIMYADTPISDDGDSVVVDESTIPYDTKLCFKVNRRTTNDVGESIDRFEFVMNFRDNHGEDSCTGDIAFIIKVENQAPTVTTIVREITMHANDTITVLPAYYDTFIGGIDYVKAEKTYESADKDLPKEGSVAYLNSLTYKSYYDNRSAKYNSFIGYESYDYSDITSDKYDYNADSPFAFNPKPDQIGGVHLGYLGIATDDAPWKMRITGYNKGSNVVTEAARDTTSVEGKGTRGALAYLITASKACNRVPLTFTITDGEGGTVTYTLYVTIVSTPPSPRDPANTIDAGKLKDAHLEGVKVSSTSAKYREGVYSTYIIPSGGKDGVEVELNGVGKRTAYSAVEIRLENVAYDTDGTTQTQNMTLYGGGMFAVNGVDMRPDESGNGNLISDYFYIKTTEAGKVFTIYATGFDMSRDYEELTFYIADYGNGAFENSLPITIRVYTVYSDMINPTVGSMDGAQYNDYLNGANEVHVKSYDRYSGFDKNAQPTDEGKPSTYAYLDLIGSDGDDGNEGKSPIVDPDVSSAGSQSYSVDVYAFIKSDGTPLSDTEIGALLVRNTDNNTFVIRDEKKSEARKYIVGGLTDKGEPVPASNGEILRAVNNYVTFTTAVDGASMSFVPRTATLNAKIMMYVQVQKRLGNKRIVLRDNDSTAAGTLFRLVVDDSAPRPVSHTDEITHNVELSGVKGSSYTLKIFDVNDPVGSLFTDSDRGDKVEVYGFSQNDATEQSYIKALKYADKNLDWKATDGKSRAFTVSVDNTLGTLTITMNRRLDELVKTEVDGAYIVKYAESVTFPLVIEGTDSAGCSDETIIMVTVNNSPISAVEYYSQYDGADGVGYTFQRNTDSSFGNEYVIDARVVHSADLIIRLDDFIVDNDYVKNGNTESYWFAEGKHKLTGSGSYLIDKPLKAVFWEDEIYGEPVDLATVTPIFEGSGSGAQLNYSAIKIHAETTMRERTGTLYICVLDRSSDTTYDETGVYIKLNVTVMNDAPFIKDGMDGTVLNLLGSNISTASTSIHIGDYLDDINESDYPDMTKSGIDESSNTYLRVYSVVYYDYSEIWSTPAANLSGTVSDDSSLLFDVTYDTSVTNDRFLQTLIIQPKIGFYGTGEFEVSVCDGNINVQSDTKFVSLRIKVNVAYNASDITALNGIDTARGKSKSITIDKLIPDVENTFAGVAQSSARANASFNPSNWYVLKSVTATSEATDYAEITKVGDGEWNLRALVETSSSKRINVTYALKSDETVVYDGFFMLNVTSNLQPLLLFKQMTFERYPQDETVGVMYHLNTNNTVYLTPNQLFEDPEEDVMQFVSVKSNKTALVTAYIEKNDDESRLAIRFTARGSANLTVTVTDETGKNYSYVVTVTNNDLEAPSLWTRMLASFESNKVMWAIIIGCIILAIIILIIVIAVLRKRRREREELEALLVSEMEIEEQMLKLAGGPSPTGYQSFGYLQSTPGHTVDPGMLLGTGAPMPDAQQLGLAAPPPVNPNADAVNPYDQSAGGTNPYDQGEGFDGM